MEQLRIPSPTSHPVAWLGACHEHKRKQIVYNLSMIRSFADRESESLFRTGKSRRFPPDILRRAMLRLNQLEHATLVDDMRFPPSNRLESLRGDKDGLWSTRVNNQWRVCFRFVDGEVFEVEIVDYH